MTIGSKECDFTCAIMGGKLLGVRVLNNLLGARENTTSRECLCVVTMAAPSVPVAAAAAVVAAIVPVVVPAEVPFVVPAVAADGDEAVAAFVVGA